jgi:hypothetical protein
LTDFEIFFRAQRVPCRLVGECGASGGIGLGAVEEDSPCESWACDAGTVRRTKAATGNSHRAIALRRTVGRCI